ncbi:glycosyltransferase family 2 protein [Mucilaginibacter polytrichastri]|uniref:glycosyltransferase family 2 protein n=1 Tax=Mucilaginibacter polytrichastri TaxID=1302689 RepID=UPI0008E5F567|nr:glycosyltransferase [Mucilaginibacter polytrichastri]SFT25637.1 Glycosyltransferase, catalytic subunit of cellulose synthase and poly-beta-1,6-N-acetylglucosamine synthase [Mucilaginibacter polytrichastri]
MIALYICISLLLTGFYLLVLLYLIRGWALIKKPKLSHEPFKTKVTILIAARNEADNIAETIDDLLAQDYPHQLTEIIIVDDHSTDNTAGIILSYADRGVKLLQLKADQALNSYKKKAISEAIARSTGDLLVATDADCRMGSQWLSTVVGYYETYNPVMISSPVTYFREQSFFERLQTLEFSFLIGIGAAFIGNGRASTCNGANLAYRKDVFYEVGGFKGIDDLASGDDELLLQKVALQYPGRIGFLKDTRAIVYTYAKPNLEAFLQQRRRWASKSTRYKDKKVVALAVGIWLFNALLLVSLVGGFFCAVLFKLFLAELVCKLLFEAIFLGSVTSFFKRKSLIKLVLLLSPIHIFYVVYVGFMGNTRKYAWKGRLVR